MLCCVVLCSAVLCCVVLVLQAFSKNVNKLDAIQPVNPLYRHETTVSHWPHVNARHNMGQRVELTFHDAKLVNKAYCRGSAVSVGLLTSATAVFCVI